jgi:hypothetical protein
MHCAGGSFNDKQKNKKTLLAMASRVLSETYKLKITCLRVYQPPQLPRGGF